MPWIRLRMGMGAVVGVCVGGVGWWLVTGAPPADAPVTAPLPTVAVDAIQQQVAAAGARASAARTTEGAVMTAQAMSDQVQARPELIHRTRAGQRVALTGTLASIEQGTSGVLVLSLAVQGRTQGLRLVMASDGAGHALTLPLGVEIRVDCLSQGVLMGEWLLADCSMA